MMAISISIRIRQKPDLPDVVVNAALQHGIENTIQNSAAYLSNWLEQLQNDKALIVQAAAQAQKAADFILGTKFEDAVAG